jgi:hypothetical protein
MINNLKMFLISCLLQRPSSIHMLYAKIEYPLSRDIDHDHRFADHNHDTGHHPMEGSLAGCPRNFGSD